MKQLGFGNYHPQREWDRVDNTIVAEETILRTHNRTILQSLLSQGLEVGSTTTTTTIHQRGINLPRRITVAAYNNNGAPESADLLQAALMAALKHATERIRRYLNAILRGADLEAFAKENNDDEDLIRHLPDGLQTAEELVETTTSPSGFDSD